MRPGASARRQPGPFDRRVVGRRARPRAGVGRGVTTDRGVVAVAERTVLLGERVLFHGRIASFQPGRSTTRVVIDVPTSVQLSARLTVLQAVDHDVEMEIRDPQTYIAGTGPGGELPELMDAELLWISGEFRAVRDWMALLDPRGGEQRTIDEWIARFTEVVAEPAPCAVDTTPLHGLAPAERKRRLDARQALQVISTLEVQWKNARSWVAL